MKKIVVLAIVFLGLLAAWFATREEQIVSDEMKFSRPAFKVDEVDRVEVGGTNKVTLVRKEDRWIVEDGGQAADPEAVKKALEATAGFQATDLVSQRTDKHADFEVDDAKGTPLKVMRKGDVVLNLVLGKWTPDFKGCYFRESGEDEVYAANKNLKTMFSKPAKGWRDLALTKFDPKEATGLTVAARGGTVRFERSAAVGDGGPGTWEIKEPAALPEGFAFDAEKVDSLVRTLASLRANDTVEGAAQADAAKAAKGADGGTPVAPPVPATPAELGLDAPEAQVTVTLKDGKTQTVTLGKEKEKDGDRYATSSERGGTTYVVAKWTAGNLIKGIHDFRNFTIVDVKSADVTELTLEHAQAELVFARGDAGWTLKSAKGAKQEKGFELDGAAVDRLASGLTRLQGDEWVEPQPADADGGFTKPTAVLTAAMKDGARVRLEIGRKDEEKKGYLMRAVGGSTLFAREWRVDRFLKKLADFAKKEPPKGAPGMPGAPGAPVPMPLQIPPPKAQ